MGFGPNYRQNTLMGQPIPGGMPGRPGHMGMGQRQQNIVQNQTTQAQPGTPSSGGYDALLQALMGQQAQGRADQQNRLGQGLLWAPGNKGRNIAAGAFSSFMGDRSQKKATEAKKEMLRLNEEDKQARQDEVFEISLAVAKSAGMPDDQANAYAQSKAQGIDVDSSLFQKTDDRTDDAIERQERGQVLKDNPDIVDRIGQPAADKFYLTGNWKDDDSGMSLQTSPDGGVVFTMGGEPIPLATSKNKGDIVTELKNAEESLGSLQSIMDITSEDYLGYGPRAEAFFGEIMDKVGMSDSDKAKFSADRRAWSNKVARRMLQYRKDITGVAGGEREMKDIVTRILNPNLGKAGFKAEMESEINEYRRLADKNRSDLGLSPVEWPEFEFKFGADEAGDDETQGGVPTVGNAAEYEALPAGTTYIDPEGTTRTKQ